MIVVPLNLEQDYPMISAWWTGHKSPVVPAPVFFSAQGFKAVEEGIAYAASWLYVVPGTRGGIGIIEFTTTNPEMSFSKKVLAAVKSLYAHVESVAWSQGCGSIMSFVAQDGSESRIMDKTGFVNVGGPAHLIYGKARPCP